MSRLPSSAPCGWLDDVLDRLAERVKDAILDCDFDDDRREPPPVRESLPPADRELLVEALRVRSEEILWAAADLINDLRPGPGWEKGRRLVAELFAELAREAVAVGLRMRTEAAVRAGFGGPPAPGLWAERYRRMRLSEGAFPDSEDEAEEE